MARIRRNLLSGTITDNPLTSGATTINSANFASLPVVTGPDLLPLVLDPLAVNGTPEIVYVTAHTASATSVTVTRGQEISVGGYAARSHPLATKWIHGVTVLDIEEAALALIAHEAAANPHPDYTTIAELGTALADYTTTALAFALGIGAWTGFTPTLVQSTTVTKTVQYGKYCRVGRTIFAAMSLAITGAGTVGQYIIVGLPVTAASVNGVIGIFKYYDAGSAIYVGACSSDGGSTTTVKLFRSGDGDAFGTTVTCASGDGIELFVMYEAAT